MEIVPPTPRVHASFLAAWDEFDAEDGQGADWTAAFGHERAQVADAEGFAAMCARRGGEVDSPPPGFVPVATLWAVEGDEWLGRVSIRHRLNDALRREGGHLGYAVRPSARRRGIATTLMQAGLDELAGIGVAQALVTCDAGNGPSARIIEAAGGVLESPPDHKRRYLVPTA
ncbi:GNAT family N-acetyltransferase [Brachybacterium squillarum]|uniref:GNAT family N-acetyltransferase n=1 Tax=Brachybacterium squillarum TaxID=661979 RepID=UPI0002629492|nr:GNAT family N-acetyltransferase [Brachybacterium squillarum]